MEVTGYCARVWLFFRSSCASGACFMGVSLLLGACGSHAPSSRCAESHILERCSGKLSSISLTDQDGFSETISNRDRLQQYESVDFLAPHPYRKVLRVYERSASGDIYAAITSYHPNGQVKQSLCILNGRAHGPYKEWYPDGVLKLSGMLIGGTADLEPGVQQSWLFDGVCRSWDVQGNLLAEIPYKKGLLDGLSKYYHPDGSIAKLAPFTNGALDGLLEAFSEDGMPILREYYRAGKQEGNSERFWIYPGRYAAKEQFQQGCLIDGKYFDKDGVLIASIDGGSGQRAQFDSERMRELNDYRDGYPEGKNQFFDEKGQLLHSYCAKEGIKDGEEVEYYLGSRPHPKTSLEWLQGAVHGTVRSWYPNGQLESQREINNNRKDGLLSAWYADGTLMLLEEYSNDRLLRGEYFERGKRQPVSEVRDGNGIAVIFDSTGRRAERIHYKNGFPLLEKE